jgi:hypothetical protein
MKTKILLNVACFMLFVATSAFAQGIATAKIPFQFTVGSKVLPAGEYSFQVDNSNATVRVVSESKGAVARVPFLTRLAGQLHTTPNDCHIVFDKVGDTCTLSEVWGWQGDGILLHATKGKHEHEVINVPR